MSTLRVNKLDYTGSPTPTAINEGIIKSWATIRPWKTTAPNFGTTAIDDSFNTSGVSDIGVGLTFHHATAPFVHASTIHHIGSLSGESIGNNMGIETKHGMATAASAGGSGIRVLSSSSVATDPQYIFSSMIGDLA